MSIIEKPPLSPGCVRRFDSRDTRSGYLLSCAANWNQTESDWVYLLQTGTGFGFEEPEAGVVGSAMDWPLEPHFAWINMVLVSPDFRGQGIARKLMEAVLRECDRADRTAVLDATDMGEGLYRKLGFMDGPRLLRLMCKQPVTAPMNTAPGMRAMTPADLDAVAELDRKVFGADRRSMLENFLQRHPRGSWLIAAESGEVQGFVVARDGRVATQVGPLVASSSSQAELLLRHALSSVTAPVFLDVPMDNQLWLQLVQSLGFSVQRGFMRMTRGDRMLQTDWSHYFAISGPDFA